MELDVVHCNLVFDCRCCCDQMKEPATRTRHESVVGALRLEVGGDEEESLCNDSSRTKSIYITAHMLVLLFDNVHKVVELLRLS